MDAKRVHPDGNSDALGTNPAVGGAKRPDLEDPHVVLSLLESDQLVAAKRRTHFGARKLSFGLSAMLWSLRVYVVVMMLLVLLSVLRAAHVIR